MRFVACRRSVPCWTTRCSRCPCRLAAVSPWCARSGRPSRKLGGGCPRGRRFPAILQAWPGGRVRSSRATARLCAPVINATGILLHTGLGRAPLADEAVAAVVEVARGYCNLELDLESGTRGRRNAGIARLLCELTGAEAATAVNNNAGATVLALRALAAGREVIVSRGQLVEIGGSFRLPEIFEVSGAKLREVGTTNKTRLSDYRARWALRRPRSCGFIAATSGSLVLPKTLNSWNW